LGAKAIFYVQVIKFRVIIQGTYFFVGKVL